MPTRGFSGIRTDDSAERRLRGVSAAAHLVLLAPCGPPGDDTDGSASATLTTQVEAADARARQAGVGGPRTVVRVSGTAAALAALADAADRAANDGAALAVLDVDLVVSAVALLDLFDHAGRRTAALMRSGAPVESDSADPADAVELPTAAERAAQAIADGWTPVRRGRGRKALVESVGTPQHALRRVNGVALGALRVDAADVPAAARLWRAAAKREWAGSPSALALLALTRGGVAVSAVRLKQFTAQRASADMSPDVDGDPWRLRLMSAARPVDGFYSIFVVRKISRAITWRLLPTGVAPNTVTVVSLLVGLLTAVLCGIGGWPLMVLAAVLLQVSLVLDCVDGEIARYTRRFSPLGAWLDVSGDRLKENGVYAGLALWSFRSGNDLWVWAVLAMALIAYRHFVDYGYGVSRRAAMLPQVFTGPLNRPDDGDEPLVDVPDSLLSAFVNATDATSTYTWVHWLKKAVHLPIGERYLIISLALLTGRPVVVFAALVVLEVLAAVYTTGGRVLRSLSQPPLPARLSLPAPDPTRPTWGEIDHQLDVGPLARGVAAALPRAWRTPVAAVVGPGLTIVAAFAVAGGLHPSWLLPAVLVLVVGLGLGLAVPVVGRLAWAAPSSLFGVEAAVVLLLQRDLAPAAGGAAFLFVAAAAYRHYDIIYRTRDLGRSPEAWTDWVTLGTDGRLLLVALAALWPGSFAAVLLVAGTLIGVFVLVESTSAWVRWLRSTRRSSDIVAPAAAPGSVADAAAEPGDELSQE